MKTDPLDDIGTMLESLRSRRGELKAFEGLIEGVLTALQSIEGLMERAAANRLAGEIMGSGDDSGLVNALTEGLRNLSIKAPDVVVNVPQQAAPVVNVPPAQVTVMPAPEGAAVKGWTMTVTSRDASDRIRTISLKPEN